MALKDFGATPKDSGIILKSFGMAPEWFGATLGPSEWLWSTSERLRRTCESL